LVLGDGGGERTASAKGMQALGPGRGVDVSYERGNRGLFRKE